MPRKAAVVESIEVYPIARSNAGDRVHDGELEIEPTPSRLDEVFRSHGQYDVDYAMSADKKWPSGPSPSPPRDRIICSNCGELVRFRQTVENAVKMRRFGSLNR